MNILFGQGKLNISSKLMNLASAGDTIKADLLIMTTAAGKVAVVSTVSNTTPMVVTTTGAHGYTTGDIVVVEGVGGTTAANGTWQAGTTASTTFQLLTRLDGVNSTGNGVYTSGGFCVDITTAATATDLGANGGSNANGTAVSLTGQTISAFGIFNASSVTWSGLSATKSWAVALWDSTASNNLIAWINGNQQVYVVTQAASSSTAIAVNRLPSAIATGTTLIFSDGASATLSSQANAGDTSLAVSSTAATIHRQATADVQNLQPDPHLNGGPPVHAGRGLVDDGHLGHHHQQDLPALRRRVMQARFAMHEDVVLNGETGETQPQENHVVEVGRSAEREARAGRRGSPRDGAPS